MKLRRMDTQSIRPWVLPWSSVERRDGIEVEDGMVVDGNSGDEQVDQHKASTNGTYKEASED